MKCEALYDHGCKNGKMECKNMEIHCYIDVAVCF